MPFIWKAMQLMLIRFHLLSLSLQRRRGYWFLLQLLLLDQLIPNNCKTKMKLILELEAYAIWYSLLNEYIESCSFCDG